jgi:hypothetical protein
METPPRQIQTPPQQAKRKLPLPFFSFEKVRELALSVDIESAPSADVTKVFQALQDMIGTAAAEGPRKQPKVNRPRSISGQGAC